MADDQSILESVKKVLGLAPDYTAFDIDILLHINSVFATLHQLGVGPEDGFSISGKESKWESFFQGATHLNSVKSYMYAKVRIMFDPPTTSFGLDALKEICKEFEWRLNVAAEGGPDYVTETTKLA